MNSSAVYQGDLTWAEQEWLNLFKDSKYPVARLAIVLFIWHEICFFGRYIPYVFCDHIPYLKKYRIQQDKIVTNAEWWMCCKQVLFEQLALQLPMMGGFYPVAKAIGMRIVWGTLFFLVVEDCYQYFVHRAMHWGPLYKHIHKIHHKFAAPFGICAEYAHPLETLFLGLGFFLGPLAWTYAYGMHIVTMCVWLAVRLVQTVDAHSGYDFPWAFVGNYASSFRFWDWLFGTSKAFGQFKAKKAQQLSHLKTE
ncbi:C-4 sterol methyl oxidase [Kappamyces sp. JEL0829]|nr:C-4 sterol methyl oxidase [Kappamyces sp. JEL0829]